MKTLLRTISIIAITLSMGACTNTSTTTADVAETHNSKNSLDWAGDYTGVIKTPDGVDHVYMVKLGDNSNYTIETLTEKNTIETLSGAANWSKDGNEISFEIPLGIGKRTFTVGENKLTDKETQVVMHKIHAQNITEKYWKLIEINGKPIPTDVKLNREPHIILKAEGNRLNGTGGCNTFNGMYEIREMNRITFSKVATTQMACPNMDVEAQLYKALETADNYTLSEDGKHLSLNKARMAPLARFEVVYLK